MFDDHSEVGEGIPEPVQSLVNQHTIASGLDRLAKLESAFAGAIQAAGMLASKIDGDPPPEQSYPDDHEAAPTGTVGVMHTTISRYEVMLADLLTALNRGLKAHG